ANPLLTAIGITAPLTNSRPHPTGPLLFGQITPYLLFDINMQSISIMKMSCLPNPHPLII
ncbi:hypothetical protein AB4653_29150, partial [Vibrio sp. 10N.222.48.A3]|uniref:hypothetical protein n=1 Tax=Vibrio sp. 10N.222.48.A3 TaxID=3229604 RepID=UPI003550A724